MDTRTAASADENHLGGRLDAAPQHSAHQLSISFF
jgi:hypothetical protein